MGAWSLRGSGQTGQSRRGDGPSTPGRGSPTQNNQIGAPSSIGPSLTVGPLPPPPPVVSRLSLSGYSGSAGRQSGLVLQGTNFSTQDADNDNCLCKCAQMLSGGGCWAGGSPIQPQVGVRRDT